MTRKIKTASMARHLLALNEKQIVKLRAALDAAMEEQDSLITLTQQLSESPEAGAPSDWNTLEAGTKIHFTIRDGASALGTITARKGTGRDVRYRILGYSAAAGSIIGVEG